MKNKANVIKIISSAFNKIFWTIDIIVYILMIMVVILQIYARVFLPKVPSWTEEISRYIQIYLVAFGAGLAIKYNAFVSVDSIFHYLNDKATFILKFINNVIVLILFLFFFAYSCEFYKLGIPRSAVSVPFITMNIIYFSMLLMSFNVLCYVGGKQIELVSNYRKGTQNK